MGMDGRCCFVVALVGFNGRSGEVSGSWTIGAGKKGLKALVQMQLMTKLSSKNATFHMLWYAVTKVKNPGDFFLFPI